LREGNRICKIHNDIVAQASGFEPGFFVKPKFHETSLLRWLPKLLRDKMTAFGQKE